VSFIGHCDRRERCPTRRLDGWVGRKKTSPMSILVEIDPLLDERTIATNPVILITLAEQARAMGDEMFRSKHPDAAIEHQPLIMNYE
jgi:hypothetical protein